MTYNIEWRGNNNTNKSSRSGNIPIAIVNHITGGSASSADSWFRSSGNKVSSAHFMVTKSGEIKQYVKIEDKAWANGLTSGLENATSELVKEKYKDSHNPNSYSVSIEHEGIDGTLTDAQITASVWLHRYIRDYIEEKYGYKIPFNRKHVIGHFEIDKKRKAYCPGKNFPWERLMEELSNKDKLKINFLGKEIELEDFVNIDDKNYVSVREMYEKIGFLVDWSKEKGIEIKLK